MRVVGFPTQLACELLQRRILVPVLLLDWLGQEKPRLPNLKTLRNESQTILRRESSRSTLTSVFST